jgi:DHA2 family multidrug resistance protein
VERSDVLGAILAGRVAAGQGRRDAMSEKATDEMAPFVRAMVTICVMMATVMQALDMTIANVALPYMQGSLSTTQDQINWVLTSYIVAAAIMTSPLGWMAARFGRKKLFIVCAAGFTVASMFCGVAQSIEQMVAFRLLQGMFGAALVPISQAVMLDAYPAAKRGQAMAIWGMGVMLGPIMGPTLGGWLTDNYSWRWVFFVNLPFGILTVLGLSAFMRESPIRRDAPFSWFGFLSLSLGIGALQMMLDRGQEQGWFDSGEIVAEAILSIVGFYFFFVDSLTSKRPFIALRIFRDWNFSIALVFMFLIGVILLTTMALVTPFIQNLLGYPVLSSGYLLGTRGVGTFFAMMIVGRLLGKYDARIMIFFGLTLATASLWQMVGWNTDVSAQTIAINSILQGVGLGFVFVPLNTIAFATLPAAMRTEGAALWTLIRNIGSSVGISVFIAQLTNMIATFHSQLVEDVTPFNDAMRLPDAMALAGRSLHDLAAFDGLVTQQAATMAYSNDFLLMTFVSLSAFPLLALIRSTKAAPAAKPDHAAVLD